MRNKCVSVLVAGRLLDQVSQMSNLIVGPVESRHRTHLQQERSEFIGFEITSTHLPLEEGACAVYFSITVHLDVGLSEVLWPGFADSICSGGGTEFLENPK